MRHMDWVKYFVLTLLLTPILASLNSFVTWIDSNFTALLIFVITAGSVPGSRDTLASLFVT